VSYTHGYDAAVQRSHSWRTAENSAGHLLPHLRPGLDLLDVGCGVGTITWDLAARVAPGRVVGIDTTEEILEPARANAVGDPPPHAEFRIGDVYDLEIPDDSFDVVHAHQVLQHLSDPVAALREMRRVCRPGGVVAVRDADYAAFSWFPDSAGISRWLEIYRAVHRGNGSEPDAGRRLLSWARAAGFDAIDAGASTWSFATPDDRRWWAETWAARITSTRLADQAIERGLSDRAELEAIAAAWGEWAHDDDGWFAVLHGEVLCRA
jgi:SAM-dependent methyltransferase